MAFSDYTIPAVKARLGLTIVESQNLFADAAEADVPGVLTDTLARYLPLAVNISTEKARSELVIAPVLVEFKLLHRDRVGLFSGVEFTIEPSLGLSGRCDFILSRSPEQLALTAPVCVVVEAKNENIVGGIPQCLAEMVAAKLFNQRAGTPESPVYGIVTTGGLWRFLRLDGTTAFVDVTEYSIQNPRKIFGILTAIAVGG
jgi:hypothetical protein